MDGKKESEAGDENPNLSVEQMWSVCEHSIIPPEALKPIRDLVEMGFFCGAHSVIVGAMVLVKHHPERAAEVLGRMQAEIERHLTTLKKRSKFKPKNN